MAIKRDKILKTAEKLVQKGKLAQAIREYEKLLKASPQDTNTINRLGDLYGRLGEIEKAVARYERVAKQFSDEGFLPKAIAIYKKINRLAPQRLDIFEKLGDLYIEQGLMVEAKNQFQMLAEHYTKSEDVESAIRAHQRLSEIDPSDSSTKLKVADLLLESGRAEEALEAYGALGEILILNDQLDEAERLFRRLLDHDLPNGEVMAPICARLLDAGRVTSAQELLTAGLEVSPDSIPLRTQQVRACKAMGETERATEIARGILEVDPDNPDVRGLVGDILISDGDQREAAEMMIPAAESLLEKADYSRAQKMLRELVEIAPGDERVLRLAIRAFRPSGDQEMLTRLTASLADVCFTSGQEDQAKRFYLELVATDPTNSLYRERLAQLDGVSDEIIEPIAADGLGDDVPSEISFTIDEDEIECAEAEEQSADPTPLAFDPSERINEAAVFAKYGLHDKAVNHLEEVISRVPDHSEARLALAESYLAIGQREKAAQTVGPVIEEHRASGNTDAAVQLEQLYGGPPSATEEQDDEVIIVEIDGDELDGITFDPEDAPAVDLSEVDVEGTLAIAAEDMEIAESEPTPVVAFSATDILLGEEAPAGPEEVANPVAETTVVDEELVEISTGVEGPSFNELAQLDLFIDQELFEDAAGILDRLEDDFPGDPDLAERRKRLDGRGAPVEPAVAEVPESPVKTPAPAEVKVGQTTSGIFEDPPVEDYVDLAKELEEELAEEEAMVEEATGRGKGEALLDEVFKEFQKGVAEQLSEEDSDTHFNLGIAYKEMGLLNEAIAEFQVASHDTTFFVEACSMIGVCANELGKFDEAAAWYQKALVAPDLSDDARTALRYELASALEKTGELEQAVGLFQEIQNHDPAYRDVGARLVALTEQRQVN